MPRLTVRVLGSVVRISALSMFYPEQELAVCHSVASQFVGHDHPRHTLKALQQPSKESFGRFCIPPWLHKDVEHDAVLIHGTPQIMLHAPDPDEHLIKVPLFPWLWRPAAQVFGKVLAKLLAPTSNGLIRDDDATRGQKELNIS
jgi:hypothetical protein